MNQPILPPILLGPILRQIILNPIINENEGNILNQSFNEQKEIIKPLQVEFKEQLEIHTVTEKDTREKLSCAICQDSFTLNEHIIKLPCNGKPHFFHKENTEECNGILPWFEEHNTCPICREEYPSEPEPEPEPEPGQLPESLVSTVDITLTPEQIADLNIMRGNLGTPPDDITLDDIDNTITNEINTILRTLIMGNNEGNDNNENNDNEEQENDNEEQENNNGNNDNEIENHIQQIITPLMNNILLDEMLRQREEEELQAVLLQSLGER